MPTVAMVRLTSRLKLLAPGAGWLVMASMPPRGAFHAAPRGGSAAATGW